MRNRLRLEWEISKGGYEVVDFDPANVSWTTSEAENWQVFPPDGFSPRMALLLNKYGMGIGPAPGEETDMMRIVEPIGARAAKIDPMERDPALYVRFANTPCTPKGVINFANNNGLLGRGDQPEHLSHWYMEIKRMSKAISNWEKVRESDPAAFTGMLKRLSRNFDDGIEIRFHDDNQGIPLVYLSPKTLVSAMWIQLALALEGLANFERCQQCKALIEVTPGSNRPDRKYCSDACRMRAYRKRKVAN
jgi:hypothetical protein